jgi:hypothetical protein
MGQWWAVQLPLGSAPSSMPEIKKRSSDMLDSLQQRIHSLEPTGTIE